MEKTMPGFFDLLKQSFADYKPNWGVYVKILVRSFFYGLVVIIAPVIVGLLAFFLVPKPLSFFLVGLSAVALVVALVYVQSWQMLALAKVAIEGKKGTTTATSADIFKSVKPLVVSYIVMTIILSLINFAGLILFIIPAVVFSVWFCLSTFTFLIDGKRGISALILSREYVRGNGVKVFFYFMFYAIVQYGLLSFLPAYVFEELNMGFMGNILSLLLTPVIIPIGIIFILNIYTALKKAKGDLVVDYSLGRRRKYYALIALPLFCMLMLAVFGVFVFQKLGGISLPAREQYQDYNSDEWNEPTELDTLS